MRRARRTRPAGTKLSVRVTVSGVLAATLAIIFLLYVILLIVLQKYHALLEKAQTQAVAPLPPLA